jgi:hypothetical protein
MLIRSILLVGALVPTPLPAQLQLRLAPDSARQVVQTFYNWYLPVATHPGKRDAFMTAATSGPSQFEPELVRWLRIDSTARARGQGEIDGLDWDPFLNSQDPCEKYTASAVRVDGSRYFVDVVGSGGCRSHTDADVVVELRATGGSFVIHEFRDPRQRNEGLIPILKRLHPQAR